MENQEKSAFDKESLARMIKAQFPEITSVTGEIYNMDISISEDIPNANPFCKALYEYLKSFLDLHGDPNEEYTFSIQRSGELIDVLVFNDHNSPNNYLQE